MSTTHLASDIAHLIHGTLTGNPDAALTDVNSLDLAGPTDLSFVASPNYFSAGAQSKAGCVIAPPGFSASNTTVITAADPKLAFVKMMWLFRPDRQAASGVHPTAIIDPTARIGARGSIGPLVTIGPGAVIGDDVRLGPSVVIGQNTRIGSNTLIYPNVTLYHDVVIGCRVIIHAGTVIGADGFGFVLEQDRHLKVPQLGNVVIEDDVELGANCTVDRATFGSTLIKQGAKTDNLVHFAHNVTVGAHALFAAQVGVAGSAKIGDYVTMAGQSGVADNAVIGDHAIVGAQTAVITRQTVPPRQAVWGTPARPMDEAKERVASIALIPKLRKRIHDLETRLEALEHSSLKQVK